MLAKGLDQLVIRDGSGGERPHSTANITKLLLNHQLIRIDNAQDYSSGEV